MMLKFKKKITHAFFYSPIIPKTQSLCKMPVHVRPVEFEVHRDVVFFFKHCLQHWNNPSECTFAHVTLIKHIARRIFGLAHETLLMGTLFESDSALVMTEYGLRRRFYVLFVREETSMGACVVTTEGFTPCWGLETGFWDGLWMTEEELSPRENLGPIEEEFISLMQTDRRNGNPTLLHPMHMPHPILQTAD